MKKIISLILVLAACLTLCSCKQDGLLRKSGFDVLFDLLGLNKTEKANDPEEGNSLSGLEKEKEVAETPEELETDRYVGYWTIAGNQSKELTIHNREGNVLYFSLWYDSKASIRNAPATLQGRTAVISLPTLQGELSFFSDSITLHITQSTTANMPVEVMNFSQRSIVSIEQSKTEPTTTTAAKSSDYILPFSSSRLLTESDLDSLSAYELRLARNEIYARHGRMFKDQELQHYFDSKSWYRASVRSEDFTDAMLNDVEKKNIQFILRHE